MTPLSRRTFLRGAGTMIGLPLLDAMLPSFARGQSVVPPKRALFYYVPNGVHMPAWTPTTEGENYALTPSLAPLESVRAHVLVLTGLANRPAIPGGAGDHARGTGSFLTCRAATRSAGEILANGISVDQVIANAIGSNTRFPSLQLGSEGGSNVGECDSGYSCAYTRNISWADATTPLPKETNPRAAFDRIFAGLDPNETAESRAKRRTYKQSVLDFVREDAAALHRKVGPSDQRRLDGYLTSLRELERRLERDDDISCAPGTRPERADELPEEMRQMADLMVIALQCDLTRVASYMLGNAGSFRSYPFIDVHDAHHQVSHHQNNPDNIAQIRVINEWEMREFAYLLERMRQAEEGDGSLLDHSLVYWSSEIEDGDAHRHTNLPVLLAGGASGAIRPGRHVRYSSEAPLANLYLAILHALDIPAATFGDDGVAPLANVLSI